MNNKLWEINCELNEINIHSGLKMVLLLNPNKEVNYQNCDFPIIWKGFINQKELECTQIESYSDNNSFIFNTIPEIYIGKQQEIIDSITEYFNGL